MKTLCSVMVWITSKGSIWVVNYAENLIDPMRHIMQLKIVMPHVLQIRLFLIPLLVPESALFGCLGHQYIRNWIFRRATTCNPEFSHLQSRCGILLWSNYASCVLDCRTLWNIRWANCNNVILIKLNKLHTKDI